VLALGPRLLLLLLLLALAPPCFLAAPPPFIRLARAAEQLLFLHVAAVCES